MYDHWNLSALYSGCDDPSYRDDLKRCEELCGKLSTLAVSTQKDSTSLIREYLCISEEMQELSTKLFCYLQMRQAVNARDEECSSQIGKILSLLGSTAEPDAIVKKRIGETEGLEEIIASDPLLSEYKYLLCRIREDGKHLLSGAEEKILAKMDISGGTAWETMRDYLTSSVPVEYNGSVTNLSEIRNMAYDASGEVRKSAYEAELKCYERIADSVAFALNSIKLQAIDTAELRGFSSVLDMTLYASQMKDETLTALLAAIRDSLPQFRRYFKAKAKLLGDGDSLPWYDLFAPVGKSETKFTPQSSREYLIKVFSSFDRELSDMVDTAYQKDWIDFFPADGKQGGAFCMSVHPIRQSRVLTNFGGKFSDVMTLAHELGHAFHNYNLYDCRPLNTDYSMPVAETASNFNEVLVMDYALSHASSREEKLALLESKLSDTAQILCDIYSRFLFEKAVIDARREEFMFPQKLCEMMLSAQKEAYGDGLDPAFLHPYMWICKGHYYSAGLNFYNWPYAFGGLFAQGLFAKYREEGASFVPLYKKLLHATPVNSVEDTAKIAGIDVTDPSFWKTGLRSFEKMIDEFVSLI